MNTIQHLFGLLIIIAFFAILWLVVIVLSVRSLFISKVWGRDIRNKWARRAKIER